MTQPSREKGKNCSGATGSVCLFRSLPRLNPGVRALVIWRLLLSYAFLGNTTCSAFSSFCSASLISSLLMVSGGMNRMVS